MEVVTAAPLIKQHNASRSQPAARLSSRARRRMMPCLEMARSLLSIAFGALLVTAMVVVPSLIGSCLPVSWKPETSE